MEYYDILLVVLQLVFCVLLFLLAGFAEKRISSKWRICYVMPVIVTLLIITFAGFEKYLLGTYIAAILLIAGMIKDNKNIRRIFCGIAAVSTLVSVPLCLVNTDYRAYDYAEDFKFGFEKMERHYVLSEHKNIDWDALYEEYYPQFSELNRTQDETENLALWTKFCAEFNDGHVGYVPVNDYETKIAEVYDRVMGNDYGLALMTLTDGRTAAVNVAEDSEAAQTGIHNGTIITSWDGVAPAELNGTALEYITFADKDNREFYRALFSAGTGGDSITVTFIDDSGNEKSAVLQKIGAYYSGRLKSAIEIIDQGIETGHLMWEDIDDNTCAFRLKMMMADSKSDESGDYSSVQYTITSKLEEMKAAGKDHVILDMRGNSGGSGEMVKAIASVFAPVGEHYYCTDPLWDDLEDRYETDENGRFIKYKDNFVTGEGLWDGKVTILVNANSVSAADHLVSVMQGMPNVTVMGFTESNGSAQGIGTFMFENDTVLSFSGSLLLDENGDVSVDSSAEDMESGNDIDIYIPFDEEAVAALFDRGEDYLLTKALER